MSHRTRAAVIYVTYDGLLEPLGQSQVVAYLERLAPQWPIHIVSFEKPDDRADDARMAAMRKRLSSACIGWTPLAYHRTPTVPATAYDIAQGTVVTIELVRRRRAAIIHARSYVAALMAVAAKRATGARFLFDMRGFWADERIDADLWAKDSALYRGVKNLEQRFIRGADHIVTLTHASAREIRLWPAFEARQPPLTVVPTCADLSAFSLKPPPAPEPFVFGYVGSISASNLLDEIIAFYMALSKRRADARLLFVNRKEHAIIRETLARHGVSPESFEIVAAEHTEVPYQIARMHAAAAIYKPSYSRMACAPTKLAEYLGCGVPCVGNVGVGDMEKTLEERRVGVLLHDFSPADHESAVCRLLYLQEDRELRDRCVATAREMFSLESGVESYRTIYSRCVVPKSAGSDPY